MSILNFTVCILFPFDTFASSSRGLESWGCTSKARFTNCGTSVGPVSGEERTDS